MLTLEVLTTLLMGYPSLYGDTYIEENNDFSEGYEFISNDILLALMIFARSHYLLKMILIASAYTEPRAQRMCAIYGVEASLMFAVKALMVNYAWNVVALSVLIFTLVSSVTLRLFERIVQNQFYHITTSMWNILITSTTVGYGDIYAMSHTGRLIAVLVAFWGAFLNSLLVYALNSTFQFNSSEEKAFRLLERLLAKD